jgi:hypothetical protein
MAEARHRVMANYHDSRQNEPETSSEYRLLDKFTGTWMTKGRQYEGPIGPETTIAAVERYEWLSGNKFLIHHFEGHVGESEAACIEIIGYDSDSQSYPVHTYYNNGMANEWRYWERGITWILIGSWPFPGAHTGKLAGKEMRVRCTVVFDEDGKEMTGKWEYSNDGTKWETFWDVKSRRVG